MESPVGEVRRSQVVAASAATLDVYISVGANGERMEVFHKRGVVRGGSSGSTGQQSLEEEVVGSGGPTSTTLRPEINLKQFHKQPSPHLKLLKTGLPQSLEPSPPSLLTGSVPHLATGL